jgi:hypothetical protein
MSIVKALAISAGLSVGFATFHQSMATETPIRYEMPAYSEATILAINTLTQNALEKRVSGESERTYTQLGIFISITPKATWKSKSGHFCRSYTERVINLNSKQVESSRVACRSKKGNWKNVGVE